MIDLGDIKLIEAAALTSSAVREALEYWQGKRTGDLPPASVLFDPLEVPRLLPHLLLQDVRREPWDFRYRVVGTVVREHSRQNWTGKWMSEIEGQQDGSVVFRVARWVAEAARPAIYHPPYVGPHKEFKYCEAAVVPWSDSAGQVDRILVAVDFLTA